ncbi:hypothetical protein ACLMNJ_27220 [Streptomyces seoulensis]
MSAGRLAAAEEHTRQQHRAGPNRAARIEEAGRAARALHGQ